MPNEQTQSQQNKNDIDIVHRLSSKSRWVNFFQFLPRFDLQLALTY
jgi:hypothetical protein